MLSKIVASSIGDVCFLFFAIPDTTHAFSFSSYRTTNPYLKPSLLTSLYATQKPQQHHSITDRVRDYNIIENTQKQIQATILAGVLSLSLTSTTVNAYEDSDYASETVTETVQIVKDATGNVGATFKAFEGINDIVTEGRGVGGAINSKGVALERGFVADEDTSIYNPGLSLLTQSEKERLVDAIIQNRKGNVKSNTWSQDNQYAYEFLKGKLDPLFMYELKGYLTIFPYYSAIVYIAGLAAQQLARDKFSTAYVACAAAIFLPALGLIALGP